MRGRAAAWLRPRRLTTAAATVAIGSAAGNWVWLSLLAALVCLATATPGATLVRRHLVALPVFVGICSCAFTLLALIHVRIDPRWLIVAVAAASLLAVARTPPPEARWADSTDGWSAAATLMTTALVARSAVTWNAADMLARLARHTDGIRHIALGAAVEQHGGYVTFTSDPGQLPGLQHYPQGGAGLLAIVLRAAGGRHPDIATTIVVGFWALVGAFAVMTWVFSTLALTLIARMHPLHKHSYDVVVIVLISAAIAVGPHFLVYEPGYFTQGIATVALLVFLVVMVESPLRTREAVAQALILVAVAQTWYLLLPVAVATGAWWWWRQPARRVPVVPVAVASPFVLFPLVTGPSPTTQLVAIGGTPAPTRFMVAALLIGGGAAFAVLRSNRASLRVDAAFTVTCAALTALMLLVGAAELVMGGSQSAYYAIKLFVLLLIFAGLAMAVALPVALRSGGERERVLAITIGVAAIGAAASAWPYFLDNTSTPTVRTVREAALYLQQHPTVDARSRLQVIYDGCGQRDRFLTHAVTTLGHQFGPTRLHDLTLFMNSSGSPPRGLAQLSRKVASLTVVTAHPCAPGDLDDLARLPGVTIVVAPLSSR